MQSDEDSIGREKGLHSRREVECIEHITNRCLGIFLKLCIGKIHTLLKVLLCARLLCLIAQ